MTSTTKLWILRVASIPIMLLLPVVCCGMVAFLALQIWGNEFPLPQLFFTLVFSVILAICLSGWTVFASSSQSRKRGYQLMFGVLSFDLLAPFLLWLFFMPDKPYDRADLQFKEILPPTLQVSGTWEGTWTDPRKDSTETITLTLEQRDHAVTGSIVDSSDDHWKILEGTVSGDRILLFYDRELSFRSRGASLLGTLENGRLVGHYFAHGTPKAGWSSKGTWQATRAK